MVTTELQAQWQAYWERTNEYPMICATVPKPGATPADPPRYLEAFEGGAKFQTVADKLARWADTHIFLGGAVPFYVVSFGADDLAAYLGADLSYSAVHATSWANRSLFRLENAAIRFDPNGKWWTRTQEFVEVLRRTLGDSMIIAAPTLSGGMDCLAGLYGVNELLYAMMDEPELVKEALAKVDQAYSDVLAAIKETFQYERYGSITRHGMYIRGTTGVPQSDFSYMISDEMFREFALPSIRHEIDGLDYAEYHLDGEGNLRHLEALCTVERLHTVQWVPGAGAAERKDWTQLYRKILSLGKNVFLGGGADGLLRILRDFGSKNLYCQLYVGTEDEYHRFMEEMMRIPFEKQN